MTRLNPTRRRRCWRDANSGEKLFPEIFFIFPLFVYPCIFVQKQAFMEMREKILQEAKSRLVAAFGDKIKDVILFGSRAWGKPHRWSDWDFVVVVRGEYDWRMVRSIRFIMADIDLDYNVFTQTLVISDIELRTTLRGRQPVFTDAIQNGIYA